LHHGCAICIHTHSGTSSCCSSFQLIPLVLGDGAPVHFGLSLAPREGVSSGGADLQRMCSSSGPPACDHDLHVLLWTCYLKLECYSCWSASCISLPQAQAQAGCPGETRLVLRLPSSSRAGEHSTIIFCLFICLFIYFIIIKLKHALKYKEQAKRSCHKPPGATAQKAQALQLQHRL